MPKILLVEDEDNLREIYEARLEAEGFTIVSAKDGEEALAVAKKENPDLIISDIMMPKISGFEMLDILRNTKDTKDVKVIMLTALGQSDDLKKADSLGANKYLVKSQVTLEDIVKSTYDILGLNNDQKAKDKVNSTAEQQTEPAPAEPTEQVKESTPENKASDNKESAKQLNVSAEPAPNPAPAPTESVKSTNIYAPTEADLPSPAGESTNNLQNDQDSKSEDKQPVKIDVSHEESQPTELNNKVDEKIENFVSGATTEATTPDQAPAPLTELSTDLTEDSGGDSTETSTESSVEQETETPEHLPGENYGGESEAQTEVSSENETPIEIKPAEQAPSPEEKPAENIIIAPTEDNNQLEAEENKSHEDDPPPLLKQKVIQPPEDSSKPDIEELYAKEQAKDVTTGNVKPVVVDVSKKNDGEHPEPPSASSIAI